MNNFAPFANGPGMGCCTPNYDSTVDQLLGNAYQVVKFVAMRMPFIKTLSDNIADIIALADSLDGLKDIEANLPALLALQAEMDKLTVLYNNLTSLVLVADNMNQVLTVHDNLPQIQEVVDNLTQIQTVVTNIAQVVAVGNNIAAVNGVYANMTAILNVNTNIAAVADVSTHMTDVRSVANNMAAVQNVHNNMAEILALFSDMSVITQVAGSLDAINNVNDNMADVNTVADMSADIGTIAENVTSINNFSDVYLGGKASDPSTRNDGSALQTGDLYFNIPISEMRVFSNSGWVSAGSSVKGVLKRPPGNTPIIATAGQTVVSVAGGYDAGNVLVLVNGLSVSAPEVDTSSGTDIVFVAPLSAGDEVDYFAYGAFTVANTFTKGELQASSGATQIGYKPSVVGALETTVADALDGLPLSSYVFGAVADGVADDTAALNSLLATGGANKLTVIAPGDYRVSGTLTLPANSTVMAYGARIFDTTTHRVLLDLSAGGCTVMGLTLEGAGNSSANANGVGIRCVGTDNYPAAPVYVAGPRLIDVTIKNVGFYGVYTQYTTNTQIQRCTLTHIGYGAIMALSSTGATITGNVIDDVTPGSSGNAYGISLTRDVTGGRITNLTASPQSQDGLVAFNRVTNVPIWEAYDTHAGIGIRFIGNYADRVKLGISIGTDGQYGAKDCLAQGNVLKGTATGSTQGGSGIRVTGNVQAGPTIVDYAANCVVVNNILEAFGDGTNPDLGGGIHAQGTIGLRVSGNQLILCRPHAIDMLHYNIGYSVSDNTIKDPHSNTISAYGVANTGLNNVGQIRNNTFIAASPGPGTNTMSAAIQASGSATNILKLGDNVYYGVTTRFSIGAGVILQSAPQVQRGNTSFTTNTGTSAVTLVVSFPEEFATVPSVTLNLDAGALGADVLVANATSPTKTGFTAVLRTANVSNFDVSQLVNFNWVAVG